MEKYEYECYQKDQLLKQMLLLELHLANFRCIECIKKHKKEVEALAEETYTITPRKSEKRLMHLIANEVRKHSINPSRIRQLRKALQSITPNTCRVQSSLSRCVRDVKKSEWCKRTHCDPYAVCKAKGA